MIKRILKNEVVKNAGWLIIGRILQMLISLVVGLLTARYLGPSNYGLINYANAYTAFFMAFTILWFSVKYGFMMYICFSELFMQFINVLRMILGEV